MSGRLPFKPFDENGEVRIYGSAYLPHWRQPGCTYFVTFRLADSVPHAVMDQWKYERDAWLGARGVDPQVSGWKKAMKSLSPKDRRLFERHFVGKLFKYLDRGHGQCVLREPEISDIVANSLLFFNSERLDTGDFVVMPNHVHVLMTPYTRFELESILHSIKSYTANQINRRLNRLGTLWMEESHDHIVRDGEQLLRIQGYIRANPEKVKLKDTDFRRYDAEYDLTE